MKICNDFVLAVIYSDKKYFYEFYYVQERKTIMKISSVQNCNVYKNNQNNENFKGYVHPELLDSFYSNSLDRIKIDSPIVEEGVQRILKGEYSTFKEFLIGNRDKIINCFFRPVLDFMKELPKNVCLNKVNTRVTLYNFERQDVFALYEDSVDIDKLADRAPYSTGQHVVYSFNHHCSDSNLDMYGRYGFILSPDKYTAEQLEHWVKNLGWPDLQSLLNR